MAGTKKNVPEWFEEGAPTKIRITLENADTGEVIEKIETELAIISFVKFGGLQDEVKLMRIGKPWELRDLLGYVNQGIVKYLMHVSSLINPKKNEKTKTN